jgi:nucleotide-binding universal stress UspA family protein
VHFSSELAPEILDVVVRLRLHDVTVEGETRQRTEASVAADLIAAAKEMQAGLIVVGGYGHSRLRERIMGGVTSGLLAHSLRPVLFSH